jgi:glutathione S-transferase
MRKIGSLADGSNWDAFRAFSPTGKVPCSHNDELAVRNSLAIAEYLAARHNGI